MTNVCLQAEGGMIEFSRTSILVYSNSVKECNESAARHSIACGVLLLSASFVLIWWALNLNSVLCMIVRLPGDF